jgi:hypothetical protein
MTNADRAKRRRPTRAVSAARPRNTDRHRANPISARVSPDLRAWFEQLAAATGRRIGDLATEALTEYREHHTGQEPTP